MNTIQHQACHLSEKEILEKVKSLLSLLPRYKKQPKETLNRLLNQRKIIRNSLPKTIGIFYPRFFDGGVERVISLQIPIYLALCYKVVLITEEIREEHEYPLHPSVTRAVIPRKLKDGRLQELGVVLHSKKIELLIHHGAISQNLVWDLALANQLEIKTIVCRHEVPAFNFMLGTQPKRLERIILEPLIYRLADYMVVLGRMEASYYRSFGINAVFIPNPPTFSPEVNPHKLNTSQIKKIVWIGRLDQATKNFKAALEIMLRIAKSNENIECYLVGPEADPGSGKFVQNFILNNKMQKRIFWTGRVKNISYLLQDSTVHLVTSFTESFSMVILESKSFGVPLVMFELQHLEILKDNKGVIRIPQGHVELASEAILKILSSPSEEKKLSNEAFQSFKEFYKKYNIFEMWKKIIIDDKSLKHSSPDSALCDFAIMQNNLLELGLNKSSPSYKWSEIKNKTTKLLTCKLFGFIK